MTRIRYSELADRLTPEAQSLFREMALAHLEAGSGDRLFFRSDTIHGIGLGFQGPNPTRSWENVDGGAIEDLVSYGLLHVGYSRQGNPNYRISGEGLHFHRWLMEQKGTPISQVDEVIRATVTGAEFAETHPGAAHHLSEAFDLLWSDRTDAPVISELGEHLRNALMDIASDVTAKKGPSERPIDQLEAMLENMRSAVGERELAIVESLVHLADASLWLDQRLTHIRDEADQGRPLRSWDEARRALFVTAFVCYEIHRALG